MLARTCYSRNYMMLATTPTSALAGYAGPGTVTTHPLRAGQQQQRLFLHHSTGGLIRVTVLRCGAEPVDQEETQTILRRGVVGGSSNNTGGIERLLSPEVSVSSVLWEGEQQQEGDGSGKDVFLRFDIKKGTTLFAFHSE